MKMKLVAVCAAWLAFLISAASAQPDASVEQELDALVARIQQKLRAGENSAAQLAKEIAAMDALRAKAVDLQAATKITAMEYLLCRDIVKDAAKTAELRELLKTKYREQIAGTRIEQEFAYEDRMRVVQAAQAGVVGKPAPELTFLWSTKTGLKKLSELKGKVVVLDFWATWCGPCVATFPEIRQLAEHYTKADVVIIGVTSLQGFVAGLEPARIDTKDDPKKELALMPEYIKAKDMTWTVAFSEEAVFNPDYGIMGIPHMAIIGPDGSVRHNGIHPAMPHKEKVALIDAVLKESGKRPPARSSGD